MAIQYTATSFLNKLSQSNYTYTNAYSKKVLEANEDVETLQVDIVGLKKTVKDLGKYSKGLTSKTRLEDQLKKFVKTYNSMDVDAAKVTDDEIKKQMEKFEKLFSENEKDLKKIGVKKSDNKLVFDSDAFDEVDDEVIKRLFEGKDSFIMQADKIMKKIGACADDSQYSFVQRSLIRTTKYDNDEIALASSFVLAKETTNILSICSDLWEAGILPEEYKEEIKEDFRLFTTAYNGVNLYDNEDCEKLKALCEEKETELASVGITIEEDSDGNKAVKYNEPDFDDPDFQNAYINLFGKESQFVKDIIDCCIDGFNNTLKPENVGVSIIDQYV